MQFASYEKQTELDDDGKDDNGNSVVTDESIQQVEQHPKWFCDDT